MRRASFIESFFILQYLMAEFTYILLLSVTGSRFAFTTLAATAQPTMSSLILKALTLFPRVIEPTGGASFRLPQRMATK